MSANWGTNLAGRTTAGVLLVLLKVGIGVSVFSFFQLLVVFAVTEGTPPPAGEIGLESVLVQMNTVALTFWATITAISNFVFAIWIFRSYHNLPMLGTYNQVFTKRRLILQLFSPKIILISLITVVFELWKSSNPGSSIEHPEDWRNLALPKYIHWWWATYVVLIVCSLMIAAFSPSEASEQFSVTALSHYGVWFLLSIPIYYLWHIYVSSVTQMQSHRLSKLQVYCREINLPVCDHLDYLATTAHISRYGKAPAKPRIQLTGSIAIEKLTFIASVPLLIISLVSHQIIYKEVYGLSQDDLIVYSILLIFPGLLYVFSARRVFYQGTRGESYGCLSMVAIAIVFPLYMLIGIKVAFPTFLAFWYSLFVALHLWLASIIIRDLRSNIKSW